MAVGSNVMRPAGRPSAGNVMSAVTTYGRLQQENAGGPGRGEI